jgi:hypothetical protein
VLPTPRLQGPPGGTRGASSGGSITVEVGPNDQSIDVVNGSSGEKTTVPVAPGKTTTVPLPPAPAGTFVVVKIGRGRNARVILVEIIGPNP